ncbi:MAG TPA: metallopeptidase TldD-related protein [Thermoanaerobaculia bacterium]|nr:metallopeptidase TldD-related protein [Thermoanaerobaculia bacterium]
MGSDGHELESTLEAILASSPADETSIFWVETSRRQASTQRRLDGPATRQRLAVTVRVVDAGREGYYRAADGSTGALTEAIRLAIAGSRVAEKLPVVPPSPQAEVPAVADLFDPAIADLESEQARSLLFGWTEKGEWARLVWTVSKVAVARTGRPYRSARVTGASLLVRSGRGPMAGSAAAAARTLAGLEPEAVVARARSRRATTLAPAGGGHPEGAPGLLWLAAETVGALTAQLNETLLSARGFRRQARPLGLVPGSRCFSPRLDLVDDGSAPGLPLPFDGQGQPRIALELVRGGELVSPALDTLLAAELERPRTPHWLAPSEVRANHLVVKPTGAQPGELARQAEGGIWLGPIEQLSLPEPGSTRFRAVLRETRRVTEGGVGESLGEHVWEDDLLRVFGEIEAVGDDPVTLPGDDVLLGGVTAPSMLIRPGGVWREVEATPEAP